MKRAALSLLLLLMVITVNADPITRQNAQQMAKSFFARKGVSMPASSLAAKAPRKDVTVKDADSYYYIFNAGENKGFVVVSGSDRTEQILGYTDSGNFDADSIPDNMKAWLQGYADEIRYVENNLADDEAVAGIQKARHAVAPLLSTLWNQGSPYNNLCPIYNNSDGTSSGKRSSTGCVATALAQVIGYYKYPNQTVLEIPSYAFTSGGKSITMSAIPAGTAIDWANMSDTYSSSNTSAQNSAVANLMLLVGTGCKMAYGSASGSWIEKYGPKLLRDYLGYDDAVQAVSRDKYTLDDWIDLIYNEVSNGRPVAYEGYSSAGGHAFVLDGYDSDELFHVNWGWGGMDNGYFRISVLHPSSNTGIGASNSSDGYSMGQEAVIGVKLPDNVDDGVDESLQLSHRNISISGTSITTDYTNWSGGNGSFYMGIGVVGTDGKITMLKSSSYAMSLSNNYSFSLTYSVSGLSNGTYKIVPISRQSTSTIWHTSLNPDIEYIKAVVNNGSVTLTYCYNADSNLKISNWNFLGNKVASTEQEVKVTFTNTGGPKEFSGTLYCFASTTSTKGSATCKAGVTVRVDGSDDISFFFTPSAAGTYSVWIASDASGNNVIGQGTVTITSTSTQELNLSIPSLVFANTVSRVTYGNFIKATINFKNNATTAFDGNILVKLYRGTVGASKYGLYTSKTIHVSVAAGETTPIVCQFDDLTLNCNYGFIFLYTGSSTASVTGSNAIQYAHLTTLRPGVISYSSMGALTATAPSAAFVAGDAAALDMRGVTTITSITPSSNPNAIYVLDDSVSIPKGLEGKNVVHGLEAESITLTDGYPVYFPSTFTAKDISYSKKLNQGELGVDCWETLALPFSPLLITADGVNVNLKQSNDDANNLAVKEFSYLDSNKKVHFDYVSTLKANIPYVMKAQGTSLAGKTLVFKTSGVEITKSVNVKIAAMTYEYNFYGYTYDQMELGFYLLNAAGTAFDYHADSYQMPPFRAFFTTTLGDGVRAASIPIEDAATGIKGISANNDAEHVSVYNLSGIEIGKADIKDGKIQMQALPKGVYIINGKKVTKY
jgi:hypothetical protein